MANRAADLEGAASAEVFDDVRMERPSMAWPPSSNAMAAQDGRRRSVTAHCLASLIPGAKSGRRALYHHYPKTSRGITEGRAQAGVAEPSEEELADGSSEQNLLLALLRLRKLRATAFVDKLFAQPAWDMLLELLECQLRGRRLSVSSLYLAAGVPPATALRRINDMERAGLIKRAYDPRDRRRQFIELTPETLQKLRNFLRNAQVWSALKLDERDLQR